MVHVLYVCTTQHIVYPCPRAEREREREREREKEREKGREREREKRTGMRTCAKRERNRHRRADTMSNLASALYVADCDRLSEKAREGAWGLGNWLCENCGKSLS